MSSAVFLDKDGTLVRNVPYNVDPEQIALMPGAEEGLRRLVGAGFLLFVVSNQPGVAHGYFDESALKGAYSHLAQLLKKTGIPLAGFFYCPHHPEGRLEEYRLHCSCRKPNAGLLTRAAEEFDVDLSRSWMVGDILDDIEAGKRAGCRTILVDNGSETEWQLSNLRLPHYVVNDLAQAGRVAAL